MPSISQYNGQSAYDLQPHGIDTRTANGVYTPNAVGQDSLYNSYDPANPSCYSGSGTAMFDLKGNRNLTLYGSVESSYAQNGWFDFDKVNDYISSAASTFPSNNMSMAFWVKTPASLGGIQVIGDIANTTLNGWVIYSQTNQLVMRAYDDPNIRVLVFPYSTYPLAFNTWYYICMSWANSTAAIKGYIYDGTGLLYSATSVTGGTFDIINNHTNLLTQLGSNVYYSDYTYGEAQFYQATVTQSVFDTNYNNTKARYGY